MRTWLLDVQSAQCSQQRGFSDHAALGAVQSWPRMVCCPPCSCGDPCHSLPIVAWPNPWCCSRCCLTPDVCVQDPEQLCLLDLSTKTLQEGPAVLHAPQTPVKFAAQLSPDGSACLLQKDLATCYAVRLSDLKVRRLARCYRQSKDSRCLYLLLWHSRDVQA